MAKTKLRRLSMNGSFAALILLLSLVACDTSKIVSGPKIATAEPRNSAPFASTAASSPEDADTVRARALLDTTYTRNKAQNTSAAALLLAPALSGASHSAAAYVEAARATVMAPTQLSAPDLAVHYHALLDKALEIDPENRKAYVLKAEAFDMQRDYASEWVSLEESRVLGNPDPWLLMGYARFNAATKGSLEGVAWYKQVVGFGPGATESEHKAFVFAAVQVGQYKSNPGEPTLSELGALVWKYRNPNDAYSIGSFAQYFVGDDDFENGMLYARAALKTMNYRVARTTLAAALYAKAADLIVAGNTFGAGKFVTEAQSLDYDRDEVFRHYSESSDHISKIMPTLRKIVL
jgi:hypothetical protein